MYRRYVDDTFCLFREREHATKFMEFISSIDPAIQFEMEDVRSIIFSGHGY